MCFHREHWIVWLMNNGSVDILVTCHFVSCLINCKKDDAIWIKYNEQGLCYEHDQWCEQKIIFKYTFTCGRQYSRIVYQVIMGTILKTKICPNKYEYVPTTNFLKICHNIKMEQPW